MSYTVPAYIADITRQIVRNFDVDPVPVPAESIEYILQADRTLYAVDLLGNKLTGHNIYSIGGADITSLKFSISIQYMEQTTYDFIRSLVIARVPIYFSPDGVREFQCVFDSGEPFNLKHPDGASFYTGNINLRVITQSSIIPGLQVGNTVVGANFVNGNVSGGSPLNSVGNILTSARVTLRSPNLNFWFVQVEPDGTLNTYITTTFTDDMIVVLQDSSSLTWRVTIDDEGALTTTTTSLPKSTPPALLDPSAQKNLWSIGVDTDGSLLTTLLSTSIIIIQSSGGPLFKLNITSNGTLNTVATSAGVNTTINNDANPLVILSPEDGSRWILSISDIGQITTTSTLDASSGPIYIYDGISGVWFLYADPFGTLITSKLQ